MCVLGKPIVQNLCFMFFFCPAFSPRHLSRDQPSAGGSVRILVRSFFVGGVPLPCEGLGSAVAVDLGFRRYVGVFFLLARFPSGVFACHRLSYRWSSLCALLWRWSWQEMCNADSDAASPGAENVSYAGTADLFLVLFCFVFCYHDNTIATCLLCQMERLR